MARPIGDPVPILLQSLSPRNAAIWIAEKLDAMRDPEFRAICLEYDAAYDWSPDDPRLPALAERSMRWLATRPGRSNGEPRPTLDPRIARLAATSAGPWSPAWDRLSELAREGAARG